MLSFLENISFEKKQLMLSEDFNLNLRKYNTDWNVTHIKLFQT